MMASLKAWACVVCRGPLAVLTNKPLGPRDRAFLEALGCAGFFSRASSAATASTDASPIRRELLSLQSLAPGDPIVMIGDSPADWKTAEAATVPFVFARYGFGASKFGATPPKTELVIDHARELDRVLETMPPKGGCRSVASGFNRTVP
jgi:phosphoglycolate phosphatase-like HAD superfamily hydrolase